MIMHSDILGQFGAVDARVLDLAKHVSLAVRIEPEFLRGIRLEMLPECDASVEVDFWFSPLVQTRGIDGVVLVPEIVAALRNELAADAELLEKVWEATERYHATISPALRIEEKVTWAALLETPEGDAIIDEELSKMVSLLLGDGAFDVPHWACYALPRLPIRVSRSKFAWILHFAAESNPQFRKGLEGAVPQDLMDADVAAVIGKFNETDLTLRRVDDYIELGAVESADAYVIRVPNTTPRMLELSWKEDDASRTEIVKVAPSATERRQVGYGRVGIRTMAGVQYEPGPPIRVDDEFEYDVLLSHSSKDKRVVRALAERLRQDGLRVWLEAWVIKPGDPIGLKIQHGLEQSRTLLLCMSPAYFDSEWGTLEHHTLLFRDPTDAQRRFIPLLIEDCTPPDVIAQFATIDWRKPSDEAYDKLLAACRGEKPEKAKRRAFSEVQRVFTGHIDAVWDVAVSPGGRYLVSASGDATARLCDMDSGELIRVFKGHSDTIYAVAISPDGKLVATGSKDGTIRLWDLDTGAQRHILRDGTAVYSIAWTPDARHLVSGNVDGRVELWERETGSRAATISENSASVSQVYVNPDGERLAVALGNGTIRIVGLNGGIQETRWYGHDEAVTAVVFTPDGRRLVSASYDKIIKVWDPESSLVLSTFEGHTESVWRVSISPNGKLLASASWDATVKLWDLESGACLHTEEFIDAANGIAFSVDGRWWIAGCDDARIYAYRVPTELISQDVEAIRYTSAKVVLVGESGVGKTGLALRLTQDRWEPTESTHGMIVSKLELPSDTPSGMEREAWLWDFVGQPDYRLIHQLYMDETALGVLVFDPQDDNPFEGIRYWEGALRAATRQEPAKLLVAARLDRGGITISRKRFEQYAQEQGFAGFLSTTAKTGDGCEELKAAIARHIPWQRLPSTSTPQLFKTLKDAVLKLTEKDAPLVRLPELRQRLQLTLPEETIGEAELRTVVGLMQSQGVVQMLDFGDFVLLQPWQINRYASVVVRTVREHPDEMGFVPEQQVLDGRLDYKGMERLAEADEKILLRAVVQTFLDRSLCLREETPRGTMLVFPSYFRRDKPGLPEHPNVFVTYGFAGPLDEIYTSLVVRLSYSDGFEKDELWKNAADFKTPEGKRVGLAMTKKAEGAAQIVVYFEAGVPDDTKVTFIRYIHEHLKRHAQDVTRVRSYVCPHCDMPLENRKAIKKRLEMGKTDIYCSMCGERVPLIDLIEEKFASDEFLRRVRELDERARINLDNESRELILVGHAIAIAAEAGQIFRPVPWADWGIDGEIEFKDREGKASGQRVYLQLKSGDSYLYHRQRDDVEVFTIKKKRHAEYWLAQAYPVMLVIRTSEGKIRWMNVTDYLQRHGPETRQIIFEGEPFTALNVVRLRDRVLAASELER